MINPQCSGCKKLWPRVNDSRVGRVNIVIKMCVRLIEPKHHLPVNFVPFD